MDRKAYQKLRLGEFNQFDTERTLRENIFTMERENLRIEGMIAGMIQEKIPVPIILNWLRQMEDNVGEIVYITALVQHDLKSYNFSTSTVYREERDGL